MVKPPREAPNVIGMSRFAKGRLLGSKPHAASGTHIDRMSDYCARCRYDVWARGGAEARPFNPLHRDFLRGNRDKLGANPQLAKTYRNWDRLRALARAESLDAAGHAPGSDPRPAPHDRPRLRRLAPFIRRRHLLQFHTDLY